MRQLGSSRVQQSRCLNCSNEAWLVSFKVKRVLCARQSLMRVVLVNDYCREWSLLIAVIVADDGLL